MKPKHYMIPATVSVAMGLAAVQAGKKIAYMLPVLVLSACAHNMPHHHNAATEAEATQAAAQVRKGRGTVDKVDTAVGIVTLTRDSLKGLGWPDMAMKYKVKDNAMLDNIKARMKVDFELTKEPDGTFVMTRITPASYRSQRKS